MTSPSSPVPVPGPGVLAFFRLAHLSHLSHLAVLGALLFAGCVQDNLPTPINGDSGDRNLTQATGDTAKGVESAKPGTGSYTGPTVTASLQGRILDDTGAALSGVIVSVAVTDEGKTAVTDSQGSWSLSDVKVPEGHAVVMAKKAGYYPGSRAVPPGEDGNARVVLRLMKKTTYRLEATQACEVVVPGGASVELPAGGYRTTGGSAYTGTVIAAVDYLDPGAAGFHEFYSGDNTGLGADSKRLALVSVGVLRVELQTSEGLPLVLAAGKPATLRYPKPEGFTGPDSLPLWYYQEASGIWIEQGFVALNKGVYEGKVTHFTDWNIGFKVGPGIADVAVLNPTGAHTIIF